MSCVPKKSWCRPAVRGIVLAFVRRLASTLQVIPICGIWYRRILGTLDQILCLLTCDGGMQKDEAHVTDTLTMVRGYEQLAIQYYYEEIEPIGGVLI
jgi:hypothetical protein